MANYGLPYMGSKNSIAEKIISVLPKKKRLYDLFCGGCAVSHAALLSNKYEEIIINDIDEQLPQLFIDALCGNLKNLDKWVSREEFERVKDKNALVRLAWSFGNNGSGYCYSREIEPYKKAIWEAVFSDDYTYFWELGINIPPFKGKTYREKKFKMVNWAKNYLDKNYKVEQLQSFDAIKRIYDLRLEPFERVSRIKASTKSYEKVPIKDDSIVYCDIPYENTAEYVSGAFNHKKFYDWAYKQNNLVVISSYEVSDKRFKRVINFNKRALLQGGTGQKKSEGLFIADYNIEEWRKLRK